MPRLTLLALASCHTIEAVGTAPPEFWVQFEDLAIAIGKGIWLDITTLVDLLL